jgi:lambda repressor-like predicted transcriptional regulator
MPKQTDPLAEVVAELEKRVGDLPTVAKESGLSYDTVLRIKNRENDPGYSKVKALHAYLFPVQLGGA